jgi:hypothetical protein|nr:hypothetical protein [Enterocloster bolteae]
MMRLEDIKGCGRRKSRIETGGKQVRRMSGTWKRAGAMGLALMLAPVPGIAAAGDCMGQSGVCLFCGQMGGAEG